MLKQNQTNMLYNIETSPEVQIQKAKDLVLSLEYDVEKYTTLLECAKHRRIEIIKSNVNYFMFQPYLRFAWEWINVIKPKLLEQRSRSRKKPNEAVMYKLLLDQIKRFVYKDIKNVTIENIYEHGAGAPYQYSIDFFISRTRKNKRHFVFYIPVIECLNEENYKYVSEGKLQLGEYISESYIEIFFSTYDENELYDALVKRLSSGETKKMNNIDKLKEWCENNPEYIGKGYCVDCKHLVDIEKYGSCSGPSLNRDEPCEPGYDQYKI